MKQCPCCGHKMQTFVSRADFLRLKAAFPHMKWNMAQTECITIITGEAFNGSKVELLQTNLVKIRSNDTPIISGEFIKAVNGDVPEDSVMNPMSMEDRMNYSYGPRQEDMDET